MTNPFDQRGDPPPDFVEAPTADRHTAPKHTAPKLAALPDLPNSGSTTEGSGVGRSQARAAAMAGVRKRRHLSAVESRDDNVRTTAHDSAAEHRLDVTEAIREVVLQNLTRGPRSRKQLSDKLLEKDFPSQESADVLDRLEEVGLIDDLKFATDFVESELAKRGLSSGALRQKLRDKGINREVADEVLNNLDSDDERELARALVVRKLRSLHGLDAHVQTRRLAGMLARKGYGSSLSYSVIREVLDAAPEHQRD